MRRTVYIQTAFGRRAVNRVVGCYVETLPELNEPHGAWWTLNPQRGYVDVPGNARGLLAALDAEAADIEETDAFLDGFLSQFNAGPLAVPAYGVEEPSV